MAIGLACGYASMREECDGEDVAAVQGVPLTQAVAQQSDLPQLQVIGGAPATVGANNNLPAQPAGSAGGQPGLPGFPAQGGPPAVPNGNLVWVGLGGSGKQTNT